MNLDQTDSLELVTPEHPTPDPFFEAARQELMEHFALIGIPIRATHRRKRERKQIILGMGWDEAADRLANPLPPEGVVLLSPDEQTVLLAGPTPRGVLNAVYVFLEDWIGFIWANATETLLPVDSHWSFTGRKLCFTPPFSSRAISTASARDSAWSARRRINLFSEQGTITDPRLSDIQTFAGKHCHNVYKLLSLGFFGPLEDPRKPYEDQDLIKELHRQHPEYFALINGNRAPYPVLHNADISSQKGNISLTHPEVRRLLVKGARIMLDHYPSASYISLSLRDNYDYCTEALQYPGGVTQALIDLVNSFAAELDSTHPDVRVDFLAYHATQRPPTQGAFHPKVTVRYCPIRVSQFHAFDESDHNLVGGLNYETPPSLSQPIKQITRWREMATRVTVWYYALHLPYFQPHPSLRSHGRNFKLMASLGVTGCSVQDNSPISLNSFNDLRAYLLTRLLWNPHIDFENERHIFCRRYYGAAAPFAEAYLDLLHQEEMWQWEEWPEKDGPSRWSNEAREQSWDWFGDRPGNCYPLPHFYTLYHTRPPLKQAFFTLAWPLLRDALQAAQEDQTVLKRLEEWQLSFYYAVLSHHTGIPELEEEARQWFPPRYEAIRKHYSDQEFHGLDRFGLSWPTPPAEVTQQVPVQV